MNTLAPAVQLLGSTTLLGAIALASEAYMLAHPEATIVVSGGGTLRGYKAVIDGSADIGLTSGPIPDELRGEAARRGQTLVRTVLAQEALMAIVHPSNPVGNLRRSELTAIFSGRLRNWRELGGMDAPITVIVGPPSGGLNQSWKDALIGADESYAPRARVLDTAARTAMVANNVHAIGFLAAGELDSRVKALAVDGVAPAPRHLRDGRYPLGVMLGLVTLGQGGAAADAFVAYLRQHAQVLEQLRRARCTKLTLDRRLPWNDATLCSPLAAPPWPQARR